jgi:hypothetical protein
LNFVAIIHSFIFVDKAGRLGHTATRAASQIPEPIASQRGQNCSNFGLQKFIFECVLCRDRMATCCPLACR